MGSKKNKPKAKKEKHKPPKANRKSGHPPATIPDVSQGSAGAIGLELRPGQPIVIINELQSDHAPSVEPARLDDDHVLANFQDARKVAERQRIYAIALVTILVAIALLHRNFQGQRFGAARRDCQWRRGGRRIIFRGLVPAYRIRLCSPIVSVDATPVWSHQRCLAARGRADSVDLRKHARAAQLSHRNCLSNLPDRSRRRKASCRRIAVRGVSVLQPR